MRFFSDRKIIFSIIAMIILLMVVFTYDKWATYFPGEKIESKEFAGHIDSIEGNLMYVSGSFVSLDHPETGKVASEIVIEIDSDTKFKRTLLYLPTESELEETGGVFYPEDLERDVNEVNFIELVGDFNSVDYVGGITIYAKTQENIYGMERILASEIEYTVAVNPQK